MKKNITRKDNNNYIDNHNLNHHLATIFGDHLNAALLDMQPSCPKTTSTFVRCILVLQFESYADNS